MFQQLLSPAGNLWISVLISLVPLVALLFMLAALRMTAWLATIVAGVITIASEFWCGTRPLARHLKSYLYGGLTGVWVIDWITFWGLMIFNTLVLTGVSSASRAGWFTTPPPTFAFKRSCWLGPSERCWKGLVGFRLSLGGSGADPGGTGNRRSGRDTRGGARQQRARSPTARWVRRSLASPRSRDCR